MKTKSICIMLLIVAATTVTIISCKKQDAVISNEQDINFFKRDELLKDVFSKLNGTLTDETLLNKIITEFKDYDKTKHIAQDIITKFGRPKWDISIVLKNNNGFRTIVTPISNTKNEVTALVLFYQNSINGFDYKIINRKTPQNKLPEYGDKDAKTFTKASLSGLFDVSNKNLTSFYKTSINSQIQTNSVGTFSTTISWVCWYTYSYGTLADGTWYYNTTGTQCSYSISIDYLTVASTDGDSGGSFGGGGSTSTPNPCEGSEQAAIDIARIEYDNTTERENLVINDAGINSTSSSPTTDVLTWEVARNAHGIWQVSAKTRWTIDFDDLTINNNKNLILQHLESKFTGSSGIVLNEWLPGVHYESYTDNHTLHPKGKATVTGTMHHKLKIDVTIKIKDCGDIKLPALGWEDYDNCSNSQTFTVL